MNKADVNQTGGLRLDTDILEFAFDAPKIAQLLGYLAHDLAIINGCSENNNVVNNGTVFINGEILPFKQSVKANTVVIVEKKTKRAFKTGQNKDVLIERWVEFGVSTLSYNWASFYRVKSLKQLELDLAQKAGLQAFNNLIARVEKLELFARPFAQGGSMLFWNKPADKIPVGWREVLNWRERIAIGWNPDSDSDIYHSIGNTGGSETHQISKSQLPNVTIGFNDAYYIESSGVNTTAVSGKIPLGSNYGGANGTDSDNNTLYYRRAETDVIGNGESINHMPPIRTVMYIEPIPIP